MEITFEKSTELANVIESIKPLLHLIDTEYAKAVVHALYKQASGQESLMVLNPRYDLNKSTLLRSQAGMLQSLIDFIEAGKKCDNIKRAISYNDEMRNKIDKLFI